MKTRWLYEEDIIAVQQLKESDPDEYNMHVTFQPEDVDQDIDFYAGLFVDDKLVGVCTIGGDFENDDEGLISDVFITPLERGKGYGKELVNGAKTLAEEEYDRYVHIDLIDSDLADWYRKMGFETECEDEFGICRMRANITQREQI